MTAWESRPVDDDEAAEVGWDSHEDSTPEDDTYDVVELYAIEAEAEASTSLEEFPALPASVTQPHQYTSWLATLTLEQRSADLRRRMAYFRDAGTLPAPGVYEAHRISEAAKVNDQAPASTPRSFAGTLMRRSQLANLPPVEPLVEDVLSRRAAAVLVGATGVGKTFVSLSLACSVATGLPWLGHPVKQARTLYVVGEGAHGLDKRVTGWERSWRTQVGDDDLVLSLKPASLLSPVTWCEMTAEALDLGIGFVILDTFSSLAWDADETKDAAIIMRRLSDLAAEIDGTALLVHHPGWSDATRTRGGYQFEANADEVLLLTSDAENTDLMTLRRKKVKDGAADDKLRLRRRFHPHLDTCVIEHADVSDLSGPIKDRLVLALADLGSEGATSKQLQDELGVPHRSSITRPLGELITAEAVRMTGAGRSSRYFLVAPK